MIDVRRVDRAWLRRRALPVALLACWLVWAALAWWTAPREADETGLQRDLAAGRVLTLTRADGWDDTGPWGRRPEPRYASGGSTVVWARPDGQFRYAYVSPPTSGGGVEAGDGADPDPDVVSPSPEATGASEEPDGGVAPDRRADPLADPRARDATTHLGDTRADALADAAATIALVLGVGWLLMLVAGSPPVVGTRWFWFWIGLLPLGLGVLAWAWRERWRADVPAGGARRSGWTGFGVWLVGGIAVSLLLAVPGALLGDRVVPHW
ncbi:hypothetical protein [Micromonospora robiginosa]|uniref:Uncharacterized protein n=1 Tax=Micromonospora robiginosa TaxID=2749844 RepID=A0A7L6B1V4_9ACTN|nr:hypothetical protein [Micromonospora ferruginea]QLQ35958.1 hypothetical protein H1D33_21785 [Micromonospora ferruginea]